MCPPWPNPACRASSRITGRASSPPPAPPAPIIAKLNAELNRILKEADVQKAIADTGSQAGGGTPEEFGAFIKSETAKWAHVIKAGNIQLQ